MTKYAVEGCCVYVSKFYWDNDVKEDLLFVEDEFYQWFHENEDFDESLEEPDDGIWHFLPFSTEPWRNWESTDDFARYRGVAAYNVHYPF